MRVRFEVLILAIVVFAFNAVTSATAQSKPLITAPCLTTEEAAAATAKLSVSPQPPLNEKLRGEILELHDEFVFKMNGNYFTRPETSPEKIAKLKAKTESKVCALVKQHGWFTSRVAGRDGSNAALYLVTNALANPTRVLLWPIIAEAANRSAIEKTAILAALIDRIRVENGLKQVFGTQAKKEGDFLMLYPIEDEAAVNKLRQSYGMATLASGMRALESRMNTPLMKAPVTRDSADTAAVKKLLDRQLGGAILAGTGAEEESILRIESNLVNLNVTVYNTDKAAAVGDFDEKDFRVFEDNSEEKIAFFSKTAMPYDLVLLLDLSGSTADKMGLIRKSTARFISAARADDRIAIVTFASTVSVVSPFTKDRAALLKSAGELKGTGFSKVWDALQFTLTDVLGPKTAERRRAVVFMTDGIDNALTYAPGAGSETNFSSLMETIRRSDAVVVPIYIDTENQNFETTKVLYASARATLAKMASESGGLFYKARKLDDLDGVYQQVLNDLSKSYSIAYNPTNDLRDGFWRAIRIELPGHPQLAVRTRAGYYAE